MQDSFITVRIYPELKILLDYISKQEGTGRSHIVRKLLMDSIDNLPNSEAIKKGAGVKILPSDRITNKE